MGLALQSQILGERASKWLALAAVEFIIDNSLTSSAKERCEWLRSSDFFKKIEERLKGHPLGRLQNFLLHKAVLPFCEKIAPSAFQKTVEKTAETFLSSVKPKTPFPKDVVTQRLGGMNTYFEVLRSAMQRASTNSIVIGSVDEEIGKELEKAQAKKYTTEALYERVLGKIISFCIDSTKKAFLERLENLPSYLYYPAKMMIESTFVGLDTTVTPFLRWYGQSWIKDKVSQVSTKDLRVLVEQDIFANPLVAPFLHFATHILDAHVHNLKRYKDPSKGPSTGVDHETWKQFLRQQIAMLSLDTASLDKLRGSLGGSNFQSLMSEIQERFALDEIAKSVDGMIGILWETVNDENFMKREVAGLMESVNQGFFREHPDKTALSDLINSYQSMREYLVTKKEHDALDSTERAIDKGVGFFFTNWPTTKQSLAGKVANWLGLTEPIKSAIAGRAIPVGLSISHQAMERIAKFYSTSYTLRYGILHQQVLQQLL